MKAGQLGELVTFESSTGTLLDGILYHRPGNKTVVVHVHGSFGNFYQNAFVRTMASTYSASGISLLSFNLTSHDGIAEGNKSDERFSYIGGSLSDFQECVADIDGALRFVGNLASRAILQGHSLGCDRVLHYLISKSRHENFVLLAPCDSYELQRRWIAPESVEQQIARLREGASDIEFDWLPPREYGILGDPDWTYAIPITRRALLSIMEGPVYKLIRLERAPPFHIDADSLIYVGGNDALQTASSNEVFAYFEKGVRRVTRAFHDRGDHMLEGCEQLVANQISEWICREDS